MTDLAAPINNNNVRNNISITRLLFMFVWFTFLLNGLVIREPAPCDLFMMAFIVFIPLFGLIKITPVHGLFFAAWMIVIAAGLIAAGTHEFYLVSVKHMVISGYLALFSVTLAAFITRNPLPHLKLIWSGYMWGAIIAALAGIVGYFDLIPGTFEQFTKYSRASGTFKDPNVFAPFLVPAFLFSLHNFLSHKIRRGMLSLGLMGLFLGAIFLSFSRGAWMLLVVASAMYIVIFFINATNNRQRIRTIALCTISIIGLLGVLAITMQSDKVSKLWEDRASLNQQYDVGDGGRFSGHKKAAKIILDNPIGIGALYFGYYYHHELPHNLYLSMYLTAGWIGGTVFLLLMVTTLILGGLILFQKSSYMHFHAISYCTFVGLFLESYIIDSDHWRLLYILMGIIWGTYAASKLKSTQSNSRTAQST